MEARALRNAKEAFDAKEENLRPFEETDPFSGNLISGFLCNIGDHRYGALYIYAVNSIPVKNQIVWSTPRMGYPFDRNGVYRWPSADKINLYEKLDGTNIIGYKYVAKNTGFITFKTRLTPVLRPSRWGDFLEMWKEILKEHPDIPGLVYTTGLNLSFELYGNMNKHTVIYDHKLDVALLFGIGGILEPYIVDPEEIECRIPKAKKYTEITNTSDLTSYYKKAEGEAEAVNEYTEFGIKGTEGYVWYLHSEAGVKQLKCKPTSIKDIHFSGSGLGKHSVRTTVINAYEHVDEVTYEVVKELLLEEFDEVLIDIKDKLIRRTMIEVEEEMDFRNKVLGLYEEKDLDVLGDKVNTMRTLSKHFEKKEMKKVYWVLINCL